MISSTPLITSALRSLAVLEILCAREAAFTGEPGFVGVADGDGVAERRLNIDCCTGTPILAAYDWCEVLNAGLDSCDDPNTSSLLTSSSGSGEAVDSFRRGLNVGGAPSTLIDIESLCSGRGDPPA